MIDAATIGITLALNNGVSDGIALIRRELTALDAAVAASSAGLTLLAALAAGSGLAAPGRIAAASLPVMPRLAPAATMERPVAPDPGEPGPAAPVPSAPVITSPATSHAADIPVPAGAPGPARAPIAVAEASASSHVVAPDVAEATRFAAFGRALAAGSSEPARTPTVAVREPNEPWAVAEPAAPLAPIESVQSRLTADDGALAPAARASVAPLASSPLTLPPPVAPAAASLTWERTNEPRAEHKDAVEISLDGAVLARWISAELANQAMRPPAGATFFDPRLSPAWPGIAGAV